MLPILQGEILKKDILTARGLKWQTKDAEWERDVNGGDRENKNFGVIGKKKHLVMYMKDVKKSRLVEVEAAVKEEPSWKNYRYRNVFFIFDICQLLPVLVGPISITDFFLVT